MKIQKESDKENDLPAIFKRLLLILGFVLLSNIFFFHLLGSVAFSLFSGGLFILLWLIFSAYLPQKYRKVLLCAYITTIGILEIITITRAHPVPVLLSRVTIFFFLSLFVYTSLNKIPFVRSLLELAASPFITIGIYIGSTLRGLLDVFAPDSSLWDGLTLKRFGQTRRFVPYIVGGVIGIPVVLFLVALLSADPIFSNYIANFTHLFSRFFTGVFWDKLLQRSILSFILFVILFPFVYLSGYKQFSSPLSLFQKVPLTKQITVILALVAVTLGAFLTIAAPYIFINVPFETDLSRFGVETYSEYVKRGFAEFLVVSLLVYSLLWIGLIVQRISGEKKTMFTWLQGIVAVEFFIFILSLFRRIYLYQQYHGWSLGRLYGGILLLWVLGISITLLFRHFIRGRFVLIEAIFTIAVIAAVGFFNAENFIATVHPPTVNKRIDYIYLARASDDGIEGWKMAYNHAKTILLDTQYDELIIGKEARREIAYAGFITHLLTNHYHELITKYADTKLKKQYYKEILQNEIETGVNADKQEQRPILEKVEVKKADGSKTQEKLSQRSWLDQLFSFNFSEKNAFETITKEISIDNLLTMQQVVHSLHKRIALQPENEQEYEVDISFDTPFLGR